VAKYSFFAVVLAPFAGAFLSAHGIARDYWTGWKIVFLSEVLAFVTVTPALLSWIHDRIRQACQHLSDLGKDIQALSHRLHSSKLEHLGLVTAAKGFCREVAEQRNVRIEFKHADMPGTLPMEISLWLISSPSRSFAQCCKASWCAALRSGSARSSCSDPPWRHPSPPNTMGYWYLSEFRKCVRAE
jgi:hypothetical protein